MKTLIFKILAKKMKTLIFKILFILLSSIISVSSMELLEVAVAFEQDRPDSRELTYTRGDREVTLYVLNPPIIATEDIEKITISDQPLVVWVELTDAGREKMEKGTAELKGIQIAIIVEGHVRSAPIIQEAPLGGRFQIANFKDEAKVKALIDKFNKING